jgi:transcriptional regulator with XRE-family HTH domain
MDKQEAIKKLEAISTSKSERWKERASNREVRKDFLEMSKTTAINILSILRQKGMTQKDLAGLLAVTPQTVNQWVKGSENFTYDTVGKIARLLEISPLDLLAPLSSKREYYQEEYTIASIAIGEEIESHSIVQGGKIVEMYPAIPRDFQSEAL